MIQLPKPLLTATLTTTEGDSIYTSGANTRTTINSVSLTNTTGTARLVTAYVTRGGVTKTLYSGTVAANRTINPIAFVGVQLDAADTMTIKADAGTAVDAVVSGYTLS